MAPEEVAVAFARTLRADGIDVPTGAVTTFVEALAEVGVADRDSVYWAGRTTLVKRPEDVPVYDRAFASFWLGAPVFDETTEEPEVQLVEPEEAGSIGVRYSRNELLRHKDFSAYTSSEFDEARRLMADLRLAGALRRSRRMRPSRRRRGRPDVRGTVRAAMRTSGEPLRRAFLETTERPRRLVLLCDVSGSMDPYVRGLVRFLHAAVVGRARVEAFALGTRLTRLTRELSSRDPDRAIARAAAAVTDWSGGTRLGDGLRMFNDEWGVRGMARGAVVVILSDGWDRGDPAVMDEQMARLSRVAHRIVWVNPLKASPGYEPRARGMAAALPYVDEFVEGHNLAALQRLVRVIA